MNKFVRITVGTLLTLIAIGIRTQANLDEFPLREGPALRGLPDCNEVTDCEESPEPSIKICGTNGETFRSVCDFMRAHCKENVNFKSLGECSASGLCLIKRLQALKDSKAKKGVFIPECNPDGTYKSVQCHAYTGYCWCSTAAGNVISNTDTQDAVPTCDNLTDRVAEVGLTHRSPLLTKGGCERQRRRTFNKNMLQSMIKEFKRNKTKSGLPSSEADLRIAALQWKFNELNKKKDSKLRRSEYKGLQKIIRRNFKPKKCAKKFPKFCDLDGDKSITLDEWITCFTYEDNNNGKTKNRTYIGKGKLGKGKVTNPRPCSYERKQALESGSNDIYVPKCDSQGKFRPVQCYGSNATESWYCFCVDVVTGAMIENTPTKYGTPNCSVSWPKCRPPDKERRFLSALTNYFIKFAKEKIFRKHELKAQAVNEENIAENIFKYFDKNGNNFIDGKERRNLKKSISKKDRSVWICGRKIHIVCDSNDDRAISLQEFYNCVSQRKGPHYGNETFTIRPTEKPAKRNPFIEILKPK